MPGSAQFLTQGIKGQGMAFGFLVVDVERQQQNAAKKQGDSKEGYQIETKRLAADEKRSAEPRKQNVSRDARAFCGGLECMPLDFKLAGEGIPMCFAHVGSTCFKQE
ncbi:hypothetical protein ROS1_27710 [Roseibium sp. ROS1]